MGAMTTSHGDCAAPRSRPPVGLQATERRQLGEAAEAQRRVPLLDGPRQVAVVAAPVARQQAEGGTKLVGPGDEIERRATPARDERRPETLRVEEAERDGPTVGAERVEGAAHDLRGGHRDAAQPLRPRGDRALGDHVARDAHEQERLRREVVATTDARPQALHHLVEGAQAHRQRPARMVGPGQRAERGGVARAESERAGARLCGGRRARGRVEPTETRVEQLEHLPVFVNDDDAAPRSGRLLVGGGPGLPKPQEPEPVVRRPALEAHVVGQQWMASL
jgi:hypothetical protein